MHYEVHDLIMPFGLSSLSILIAPSWTLSCASQIIFGIVIWGSLTKLLCRSTDQVYLATLDLFHWCVSGSNIRLNDLVPRELVLGLSFTFIDSATADRWSRLRLYSHCSLS